MSQKAPRFVRVRRANIRMLAKLGVIAGLMFGFGYAMVPIYRSICDALGVNVLALSDNPDGAAQVARPNTQVDASRWITVQFDTNSRGPYAFKPAVAAVRIHPGELSTVMYEFRNQQSRTTSAQAIPSYAPSQAAAHFVKLECFCFHEYTLAPGESKKWPVVFYVDRRLPHDVDTITLSYTFFEVEGKQAVGSAPGGNS